MNDTYKLEFEIVNPIGAGARFYRGDEPICTPLEVPEVLWQKVTRETNDPWQQYNQLKLWAQTGAQLVRNIQLFKATSQPTWEKV